MFIKCKIKKFWDVGEVGIVFGIRVLGIWDILDSLIIMILEGF